MQSNGGSAATPSGNAGAAAAGTSPTAGTNPEATSLTPGQRAIANLRQRLMNLNPIIANAPMEYTEEPVFHPGGIYINKLIKVWGTNGRTESYDANLVARNPDVTANEIARIFV